MGRETNRPEKKRSNITGGGWYGGGGCCVRVKIRVMVAPHHPTQHKTKKIEDLHKTKIKWRPRNQETNKVENMTEGGRSVLGLRLGLGYMVGGVGQHSTRQHNKR